MVDKFGTMRELTMFGTGTSEPGPEIVDLRVVTDLSIVLFAYVSKSTMEEIDNFGTPLGIGQT